MISVVFSAEMIFSVFFSVAPVPTACQLEVEKALQTPYSPDRFVPRCKEDGSYEDVQCSENTRECWCVNSLGVEQRGTRSRDFVTCPVMGKRNSEFEKLVKNISYVILN